MDNNEFFNNESLNNEKKPFAILAALETDGSRFFDHRIEEMESLIEACDMEVAAIFTQKLPHPEPSTFLGKGKASELAELAELYEAEYCIFEDNLSPVQLRNLQKLTKAKIWDRTTLILEIFSRRAKTREARLQVESAYLQYMLPRLSGMWQHLGRQSGGGGSRANKGIGETQLELDRRQINKRIASLSKELEVISHTRDVQRQGRIKGGLPRVALVGYTNAGKSTLMNRLLEIGGSDTEKQVFEKDMLFATLDTSVRLIQVDGNKNFLLSDTVGFIENLPHGLINAFRSTLEEAAHADLILVVLDASDEFRTEHRRVTSETLKELKADTVPRLYVMNKADLVEDISMKKGLPSSVEDEVWISARSGDGISDLLKKITGILYSDNREIILKIPFSRGDLLNRLHKQANVISEEYTAEGTVVNAECPPYMIDELRPYIT